ncbi:hypothetical protein QQF64_017737 [Cirrhinus molitorella]|uniref:Uncharacterized protein n=1 Tax=Cirrhinus molitorella TaxID=172907 RepID=A0ABR3LMR3_9TELE
MRLSEIHVCSSPRRLSEVPISGLLCRHVKKNLPMLVSSYQRELITTKYFKLHFPLSLLSIKSPFNPITASFLLFFTDKSVYGGLKNVR